MNREDFEKLVQSNWPVSELENLKKKHGYDPKGMTKFYNHDSQIKASAEKAEYLSLEVLSTPQKALDIGPAAGHWPYLLQCLGYSVDALELDFAPYLDSLDILNVKTSIGRVEAFKPLPKIS